jgi:hypothetical protein
MAAAQAHCLLKKTNDSQQSKGNYNITICNVEVKDLKQLLLISQRSSTQR